MERDNPSITNKLKEGFEKVEHEVPLQSLQDIFNFEDLYAFDERIGYLTQCPTNLGTGMRASVMMHLPALSKCNQISKLASTVSKLGLTIRGSYGEGTNAKGDIFQLSNQLTLGISERTALDNLKALTMQIATQERSAGEEFVKNVNIDGSYTKAGALAGEISGTVNRVSVENVTITNAANNSYTGVLAGSSTPAT